MAKMSGQPRNGSVLDPRIVEDLLEFLETLAGVLLLRPRCVSLMHDARYGRNGSTSGRPSLAPGAGAPIGVGTAQAPSVFRAPRPGAHRKLTGGVLNVWLRTLEHRLRQCSPGVPATLWALVTFVGSCLLSTAQLRPKVTAFPNNVTVRKRTFKLPVPKV